MPYIDLDAITPAHIGGRWQVNQKYRSNQKDSNFFFDIHTVEIDKNIFRAVNGKKVEGKVEVIRENEIIYNPQIIFYVREKEVANAIITKFVTERIDDKEFHKLTLYFTTGLELTLIKN